MSKSNKSPLRYPGGKTRACQLLLKIIDEHFEISEFNCLLSPFFGGGSFEFYFNNQYNLPVIANDKFEPLVNFWKVSQDDNEQLLKCKMEAAGHGGMSGRDNAIKELAEEYSFILKNAKV